MADILPLTLNARGRAVKLLVDATLREPEKLPPLTREQRERMMRAAGAAIKIGWESGQTADDLIPLFALAFALARYKPKGRRKTGKRGRPTRISVMYPTKEQKRRIAREKRQKGEGKRGPRRGAVSLPRTYAQALLLMLDQMVRKPADRKNTAAASALRKVKVEPTVAPVKRLVQAWDRARYAADLPTYRRHRALLMAPSGTDKQASAFSGETLSS